MSKPHTPHAFVRTLQHSEEWVREVMVELQSEDIELAYAAVRGSLHALRDRLPPEEAIQLAAQLPLLLRGVFFDGFTLKDKKKIRSASEFLVRVYELSGHVDLDPERAARAVFKVLDRRISGGEIDDVIGNLPAPVAELWNA
jgi:uncharacterized protein (DUF2267 family)